MRVFALWFFSLVIFNTLMSQGEKYENLILEKNKLLNESTVLSELLKETQSQLIH